MVNQAAAGRQEATTQQDHALLEEVVRRLVPQFHPERIYLFGSRARGDAKQDSDYDFLVVVPVSDLPPHQRDVLAFRALREIDISTEVLVYTRDEFESRKNVPASLPATVLREGKLLYAA